MRTVFILGAGASRPSGVPTMKRFLDEARRIRGSGAALVDDDALQAVVRVFENLERVVARARIDILNLEELYGSAEMGALVGNIVKLPQQEVAAAPEHFRRTLTSTVTATTRFRPTGGRTYNPGSSDAVCATGEYPRFVDALRRRIGDHDVGVITFNFDIALDHALEQAGLLPDYGLPSLWDRRLPATFRLHKLHGSLNWVRCPKCSAVLTTDLATLLQDTEAFSGTPERGILLDLSPPIRKRSHCGVALEQFIVPPTWNKTSHLQGIKPVWEAAFRQLHAADQVIVIGYSLPRADNYFRQVLALAISGDSRLRQIRVYDPDREVEKRFATLLSEALREQFRYREGTFANALDDMNSDRFWLPGGQ